jgi:transcription elongation factor GreA
MLADIAKVREPSAQLQLVEKYLRECKARGEAPSGEALHRCFEQAAAHAKELASKHSIRAALGWAVAGRIGELGGAGEPWNGLIEFLRPASDVRPALSEMDDPALFKRACAAMQQARPADWQTTLAAMLPSLAAELCDDVAQRLVQSGWPEAEMDALVQRVLSSPAAHFEALLWLWDGPSSEAIAARLNPLTALTRILRVLDQARRGESIDKERAKTIAARARTLLSARRYERFRRCLQGLDPGMAAALRTQITQLDNLGRAVREDLLDHLRTQFPSKEPKPVIEPWNREDVLYVTADALTRKKQEVEHHVNVKMRDNARAIGAAAERGDLSENSEYKFALEERDLLRARLAQMNSELALAKTLTPGDVPTDRVGIGTRIVFQHVDDGERYEMTIVGAWDADHERNWFNYKAPLSQGVLGKRIGDTVEFHHDAAAGTYRIAELHNALLAATPQPAL